MASKEELIQELSDAVISCKKDRVIAAVEKAKEVIEPAEIIEKGLAAGMNQVGVLFERGKLFLPHVMMAADAMSSGVKILEADMPAGAHTKKLGVIVNGTVEGDVHDIGKSIVSTMLQSAGFEVYDIGRDVPIRNIYREGKGSQCEYDRDFRSYDYNSSGAEGCHRAPQRRRTQGQDKGHGRGSSRNPGLGREDRRRLLC